MVTDNSGKPKIPLIGLLAVKNLIITKEELQKGLSQCVGADNTDLALKEYFLSNELVSSLNMERLLRAAKALEFRKKEFKFGDIAIRKGFINHSVLKLALEEQENDFKNKKKIGYIGDMLVDAGLLTEEQRDYILDLQKRVRQEAKVTSEEKMNGDIPDGIKTLENQAPASPSDPNSDQGLSENDEDGGALLEPEIITGGIKLEISKNFMAAFLSKTVDFNENITVKQIKEALFDKDIVSGLVVDEMLEGFVKSSGFKTKSFRVAKGVSPIQGKDAKIEFFFNTDYLKAGGLSTNGTIDFKERGEIPYVEEGTVLAEKIPMLESRRGHNIYGDEIEIIPGKDIAIKFGKGAKLSEDGFKVLAAVQGFPKYSLSGYVFVLQEYVTEGDVDYETGHIDYAGNINIKGRVKSGFKVKGNDIQAIALDGGSLNADGDIRIAGGINEGKIYARGNVYAKFILKSEVLCMGDVVINKEIVDTDVECSGSCVVENGNIISSKIAAKMGVKTRNIGTEKTDPNVIKVGHDAFTEKELEKNRSLADRLKEQIERCQEKKAKLKQENLVLQKQITEFAHVQDRSQLEEKEIKSKISLMEKDAANNKTISELKTKIEQLKTDAQRAEENLDACFDKSEKIEETMEKEDREIDGLEERLKIFLEERSNLIEWAKDNPGKPVVIVEGAIMGGTVIMGQHSEKRVTEVIRHTKIMEVLCSSDDGRNQSMYEMKVGSI